MLSIRCYVVSSASRGKTELFTKSKQGSFFQEPPCVTNPFLSDHFLQRCLAQLLPNEVSVSLLVPYYILVSKIEGA